MTCTFPNCDCVRDNLPLCKKSSIHAIYPTKAGFGATQRLYTEAELQAAIAAAMMGAYKEGWSDGAANYHHDRNETSHEGWLISDTYKSIPTDATAAAIRAMKGGA